MQNYLNQLIPQIQNNSNMAFIGQKGCGKTSLGQFFQPLFPRKVIIDTKGEYFDQSPGNYHAHGFNDFITKLDKLLPYDKWNLIYHFSPGSDRYLVTDEIVRNVYQAEQIYTVIEEIHLIASSHRISPHLLELVSTGRSRDCGYMITSTRPAGVHNSLLTEIDFFFLGRLLASSDRDAFRDILGESKKELSHLQNYNFMLYNVKTNEKTLIQT